MIEYIFENHDFENLLCGLPGDVKELLSKNTVQKILAYSFANDQAEALMLGHREMRHLVDGPIEQFFRAKSLAFDDYEIQMALYKLIKAGYKTFEERFKQRYNALVFNRWYAAFDATYLKNRLVADSLEGPSLLSVGVSDEQVKQISEHDYVQDPTLTKEEKVIWNIVMGRSFGDADEIAGLALRVQIYLLNRIDRFFNSKKLDVELELLLHALRNDPSTKGLYTSNNEKLRNDIRLYDRVTEQNRNPALFQQAYDGLLLIHQAQMHACIYTYTCAWQKCIEFARLDGYNKEQHSQLAALLYSKLDVCQVALKFVGLKGRNRYCYIGAQDSFCDHDWVALDDESALLRHLASALYASGQAERHAAQTWLFAAIQKIDEKGLWEPILQLIYENTMNKIITGSFAVCQKELELFIEGPAKVFLRKDNVALADCKLQHALFFLVLQERALEGVPRPVSNLFLQLKGEHFLEKWYQSHLNFVANKKL